MTLAIVSYFTSMTGSVRFLDRNNQTYMAYMFLQVVHTESPCSTSCSGQNPTIVGFEQHNGKHPPPLPPLVNMRL